jgi:N-acetylglutamate synthase-like GNAT family acetyltransferase
MSVIRIEIFTEAHKEEVIKLILGIQVAEFGIPISLEQQPDLNRMQEFYQTNKGNFWVAKIQDEIIGTIALLDIGNNKAALRKMFVNKNYRGQEYAVGQKLLNVLIDWAKQKGTKEIFLGTTEKFIRAQHFYEKNGFIEIDKRELPKTFPVMEVDIKFYRFSV